MHRAGIYIVKYSAAALPTSRFVGSSSHSLIVFRIQSAIEVISALLVLWRLRSQNQG
jgi:hypothetical protein